MIEFLIYILVLCVVIYVLHLVIDMLSLPSQVRTIAFIIIGLVVLLLLLKKFGVANLG